MRVLLLVSVGALVLAIAAPAGATLLADMFGVSLSVGPSGYFNNSWTPTSTTADYLVDDNWSLHFMRAPYGGELFDIEAIYFDNDADNAYVAVVGSFPVPMGVSYLGGTILPGDLAIDLGRGTGDLGIDVDGGTGLVADTAPGDWYQSSNFFVAESGPTNFTGGVALGYASLDLYNYGLVERGNGTYVFEMTIDRDLLGSPMAGDYIGLDWTMGCRNDYVHLDADFDGNTPPPVPEPGTLLLLGSGLLGAVGFVRKRLA
jgi:hypothetical protein